MADSFTLPLRHIHEKRERPDTLPVEIAQINSQWGSFRDVNEEVLRQKMAEEADKDGVSEEDESDEDATDLDSTERLEQLYKRRTEITEFAMKAHMETLFALDFVSLLLSKQLPRQAETSISPYLKQIAPLGSLHAEVVNPPPKPASAAKDISVVSRGWRIQNFKAAANKLLQAASRLETEVAAETRYWNEVLAIKDKGWGICRSPRNGRNLAVQYGFLESTPIFRDRGLAPLHRAQDGSLHLDEGVVPSKASYVRVRVIQDGRLVGYSKPTRSALDGGDTIESRIRQARDTLFEEELFHELVREARAIASFGVTTRENLIEVPGSDDLEILLDLVDADEVQPEDGITRQGTTLAQGIGHAIGILLAYAHRQNLRRRSQIPPPLTPKKPSIPEYQLIRPVLTYIKHISDVRWVQSLLKDLFGVLQSAKLNPPAYTTKSFSIGKQAPAAHLPAVEAFVGQFLAPFESTFSGKILTPRGSFSIAVRTSLSSPPFGTSFNVSFNSPMYPDFKSPGHVSQRQEVEAAITHLLLLDVVFAIASNEPAKPKDDRDAQANRAWDPIYPQHGELLLSPSSPNSFKRRKMKVALSRDELSVEVYKVHCIDGTGRGNREKRDTKSTPSTWSSSAASPDQPSLMEFVTTELSRS
ncbi:Mediator complex subunit Med17 [Penicillium bovifimosum]|uniref:Mediator of RNA polymerase II transcription subunit 17 n=1 Tax=Penicillium bovifimosum TaxID=126998 RepID=A0A9W9GV89_9EURO|nr:Mediator complex subunit Med17 [Penicillium bovifimosum]KAJ5129971.1 Mediator complex subunit Med17 [Penicillium bovifimosum]